MSRIVLASTDPEFEVRIRAAFDNELNGHLRRMPIDQSHGEELVDATAELTHDNPDVVAFGEDVDIETALRLARTLDRDRPEVTVMLVTKPGPKLWERAMKAGVEVVLAPDAGLDEFREEFDRALEAGERRRANLATDGEASQRAHRVIVVSSPKGGAGKSVVATNLAIGLAAAAPEQVVIVDLDLQFGDVAGALQLVPQHTIVDAALTPDLDLTSLKVFLTPHPSGLFSLCGPESPAAADDVSPEVAGQVIELLSEEFRYVVVDTPGGIGEATLAAFEAATDFVLVGNMDVPSVRALRKEVEVLDTTGFSKQRRHFVLNRADTRVGLSAPDVEATVGLHIDVAIPSSRTVPLSFNQGTPIIQSDPRSEVSKGLTQLVHRFVEVPAQPLSTGRRLRRR